MRSGLFSVVLGAALVMSVPLTAHHGAASFDADKEITLKGTVTEWLWANPHCFLSFDAKDDTGMVRHWSAEVGNPPDITKRGWSRTSFKAGDVVTVMLQAVKNGSPVGRIRSVILANGQVLAQGGPAPGAAPAEPAR